ncbi:MAG: hypothetical protein ACI8Q1_002778 [Parvicella sp.]|jgi:hypothetical protein
MKIVIVLLLIASISFAQNDNYNHNKFKQLKEELATPNVYRTGAGAPGHKYYQNRADYKMDIQLDNKNQKITGYETITYHNDSPDALEYLWIQLDQNVRANTSDSYKIRTGEMDAMSFSSLKRDQYNEDYDGGFKITSVSDASKKEMPFVINKTMMRIDLATPLAPGATYSFNIGWWYYVNERAKIGGRSGFEYFKDQDAYLYTIAQFFPRMCVYNDVEGWQNKQFLGSGEFTLPFGDYNVSLTVPDNHIVASTGELSNPKDVLTPEQISRFNAAKKEETTPVFIVTEKEAIKNTKTKSKDSKTWNFVAKNVRDFGWASSKKFIWDAMNVKQETTDVMAMSYYPKEGNPLWEQYSTKAVAQTLRTYSKHTFDYPYPVAISVHTDKIGMEYPMICFNGGRPEADGTYSERTKYGMIGVIIHEVGHNYFPMIINSDERQWTWMDEGLNTFLQFLTEKEWDKNYPSRRGPAYKIVDYMKGDVSYISPIMTNSESLWQFGNNAYGKPATALNILRETVMGRELFDFAFKTYAQRWMFKQPTPADLFRTMEDASAVDLDWFWRGWFFTTDHVDMSIDGMSWYKLSSKNPKIESPIKEKRTKDIFENDVTNKKNEGVPPSYIEEDTKLNDFYNSYNPFTVTPKDEEKYEAFMEKLDEEEKKILSSKKNYYEIHFSNKGGLVMPILLEFTFKDGSKEEIRIPAEIWARDNYKVSKVFTFNKEVASVVMDKNLETADTETYDNHWPRQQIPTRFELYKNAEDSKNPMQK